MPRGPDALRPIRSRSWSWVAWCWPCPEGHLRGFGNVGASWGQGKPGSSWTPAPDFLQDWETTANPAQRGRSTAWGGLGFLVRLCTVLVPGWMRERRPTGPVSPRCACCEYVVTKTLFLFPPNSLQALLSINSAGEGCQGPGQTHSPMVQTPRSQLLLRKHFMRWKNWSRHLTSARRLDGCFL